MNNLDFMALHPAKITGHNGVDRWNDLINDIAIPHDIPPNLIKAIMLYESGGDPYLISQTGHVGLMQLHDGLRWPKPKPKVGAFSAHMKPTFCDRDALQAHNNIEIACVEHIEPAMLRYGRDLDLVIAAYTAGFDAVELSIKKRMSPGSITSSDWYVPCVRGSFLWFQGRSPK